MQSLPLLAADCRSENGVGDAADVSTNEDEASGSSLDMSTAAANCLFTLQVVNSYGSTEVDRLVDDGKPLNLEGEFISCYDDFLILTNRVQFLAFGFESSLFVSHGRTSTTFSCYGVLISLLFP